MTPDPPLGTELQAEAAELSRIVNGFRAAAPAHATGTDGSGQVNVTLGPDGHPEHIHVRVGWNRHLEPAWLGAAVVDATEDAARTAARQWSGSLDAGGWPQRADANLTGMPHPGGPTESEFSASLEAGQVRDVNELAEAVIRALQNATAVSAQTITRLEQPPVGEGTDDRGHVRVTISGTRLTLLPHR